MLTEFWAQAVYDLRLTSEQFWALTPRLFHVLYERHKAALVHTEMCHAFTTAAVLNTSPWPQKKASTPLQWMPNHRRFAVSSAPKALKKLTPTQARQHEEKQAKLFALVAELKRGHGPMLDKIAKGEKRL